MADELINTAQRLGCSPAFVEFKQLPVTFRKLLLPLVWLSPTRQDKLVLTTATDRNVFDLSVETGPEGTAIMFYYPEGGTNAEIIFDAPNIGVIADTSSMRIFIFPWWLSAPC